MWKITQRLDRFLREKLTRQTFAVVVISVLVLLGTWAISLSLMRGLGWPAWTGFSPESQALDVASNNKTLWDWIQILLMPVVTVSAAIWIMRKVLGSLDELAARRFQQDLQISEGRRQSDLQIAQDNQREAALRDYFARMEAYLLDGGNLSARNPESQLRRGVARLRTITTVRSLDRDRLNMVFQYLRDAGLALNLMVEAELQNANLEGANLSQIRLRKADLSWSNLQRAYLRETDLSQARLYNADLGRAILLDVNFHNADLCMADLSEANLTRADLTRANLNRANLNRAILHEARLVEADLSHADLINADLAGANLSGATVAADQLNSASSLSRTILPDGNEYIPGEMISAVDIDTGNWRKNRSGSKKTASAAKTNTWRETSAEETQESETSPSPNPAD